MHVLCQGAGLHWGPADEEVPPVGSLLSLDAVDLSPHLLLGVRAQDQRAETGEGTVGEDGVGGDLVGVPLLLAADELLQGGGLAG